jgi:ribonuclease-3
MSSHDSADVPTLVAPAGLEGRLQALRPVEVALGHHFANPSLVELALRHRSWCAEHGMVASNERLEFLGDSVLGMVIARWLYVTVPEAPEGVLARYRAELVNGRALADMGRSLGLGPAMQLGRGERATGGDDKNSILADALEALIGAVFLDAGYEVARDCIHRVFDAQFQRVIRGAVSDYKSALQEHGAAVGLGMPSYEITSAGPEHAKTFSAVVRLGDELTATGAGHSKKAAEQAAAQAAFDQLAATTGRHLPAPADPPGESGATHG